jgi:hypothetical protein
LLGIGVGSDPESAASGTGADGQGPPAVTLPRASLACFADVIVSNFGWNRASEELDSLGAKHTPRPINYLALWRQHIWTAWGWDLGLLVDRTEGGVTESSPLTAMLYDRRTGKGAAHQAVRVWLNGDKCADAARRFEGGKAFKVVEMENFAGLTMKVQTASM